MTQAEFQRAVERATHVLEFLARANTQPVDRMRVARSVSEMVRAISDAESDAWLRRLIEAGVSVGVRLVSSTSNLDDAIELVRQGIPVVAHVVREGGNETWLGLAEVRRSKVRVVDFSDNSEQVVSRGKLRRMLGLSHRRSLMSWILGQPALPCGASHGSSDGHADHEHVSPTTRLWNFLLPERHDLWVVVLFSMVVGILTLATPITVEALVNTVAFGRYLQPVIILSLILLTFLGLAATMRAIITWVVELLQRRLFVRVVEDLSYRLPRVEHRAWDERHGPELVNRFFDIVTVQKVVASLMLDGISIVLQTIIGMAVLAFYHPFLLGFDVVLLASIGFIIFRIGRGAVSTAIDESKAKYQLAAWLEDLASNTTAFKFDGGANLALERADKLAVDYLQARRLHFRIVMRQICLALGLQAIAATTLLGLGGWLVLQGELTLGQLVAAELIVMTIVGSFAKIGKHLEGIYDLLASVDKLGYLFDLPVEQYDRLWHGDKGRPADLCATNVSLSMNHHPVVSDISFQVTPGESMAIIGPPGSGKTLLTDLIAGLRQPDSGFMEIDEIDMRELRPDSIREQVALCRDVEIFQGTIDENIRLHRLQIDTKDVTMALRAVGLLDEIRELPAGVHTPLHPHGGPLSSSQAVRLMLARAIVGRPRLLLIDGLLDRLGDQELQQVLDAIHSPTQPWTLVVATGRAEIAQLLGKEIRLRETQQFAQAGK